MSICCSNPGLAPNYTVCFPDQQTIPGGVTAANPFYDFDARESFWTYTIEIDPGGPEIKDLSNWVLQICPKLTVKDFVVEISQDGQTFIPITHIEVVGVDPPSGVLNVLKINRAQKKGTTLIYRIKIINPTFFNLAGQPGTIAIKAGTGIFLFNENSCLHALPTPSLDCITVHRPHQGVPPVLTLTKRCPKHDTVIYSIGDTITLNLEVTNPGTVDVAGVTVLDLLNIPLGVIIGAVSTDPVAVVAPLQPTYTNQDILFTWSGLTIPPGVTSLAISFTILDAPVEVTFITNVDAGIETLSGTDNLTCVIAVYHTVQIHSLDCNLQLCLVFNSRALVNLLVPSYGFCVPGSCPTQKLLPPNSIECIVIEKIYDSCFQNENIFKNTTVPFPELVTGQQINCTIHDLIFCEILEQKDLGSGFISFILKVYVTLILQDPVNDIVSVIRVVNFIKTVTLCAPESTIFSCANSQPISCICIVTN